MTETAQAESDPFFILDLPDEAPEDRASFEVGGLDGDRPSVDDLLGVQRYADALARFVLHSDTQPLVIGIHGPWGKGKSTFMRFVESALVKKRSAAEPEIVTVDFNAWRYQDSRQIWAGLASAITERLEQELSAWGRTELRIRNAWARRRSESLAFAVVFALAVLTTLVLWLMPEPAIGNAAKDSFLVGLRELFDKDKFLTFGLGGGAAGLVLLWRLPNLLHPFSQRILEYGRLPDYRGLMGYQHRVLDDIRLVYSVLKRRRKNTTGLSVRVVVFIDDLDRCSEEKIVKILQAINLILGASEFFVFLGVASEMLQRAIRQHYKEDDEQLADDFPLRYLEKIIQLSFRLPRLDPERQAPLISRLFSEKARADYEAAQEEQGEEIDQQPEEAAVGFSINPNALGYLEADSSSTVSVSVRDTVHELRAFLALHRYLDDNPRVKKHVVNIHRLVKILLQEPGIGWPVARQQQLVIWLIFCHCWPKYAVHILEQSAAHAGQSNVLGHWFRESGIDNQEIREFIDTAESPLPGDAFGEGGFLRQAMELSRMATTFSSDNGNSAVPSS